MDVQQIRGQRGTRGLLVAPVPQEFQEKPPIRGQREIRERRDLQEILALLVISALLVILVPQAPRVFQDKQRIRARLDRLVWQDRLV
jgi:hypothetical protein